MGEDAAKVHQSPAFQRVHLELAPVLSEKLWTTSDVADFLCSRMNDSEDNVNSILVIHNTKSAARKLYTQLKKEEWVQDQGIQLYHLSTSMCPAHRKDTLDEVRKGLIEHKPIICISTQLIEAGVDISFQCVLRSLAGLDSIAQAAGRCNRHGEVESRNVYVFRSAEENLSRLKEIEAAGAVTCRLLREVQRDPQRFGGNLLSQEAMRQYFEYVYYQLDNSQGLDYLLKDKGTLYELLDRNRKNKDYYRNKHGHQPDLYWAPAWATAEEHFEVISNSTRSVLVPYHDEAGKSEADRVIADLNGADRPEKLGELLREAQQYVVNLYEYEWQELSQGGYLHPLLHGNCWVLLEQAYSKNYGIDLKGEGAETSFAGA
ncbi:helicase-related protein [Gorillibacterium sp. CAU 1737]|uniref:helicase-related protein n=1 Tax=Gorillibacterium sp. CAU 1737 TaxID=3140362 RepID=UPI0032606397